MVILTMNVSHFNYVKVGMSYCAIDVNNKSTKPMLIGEKLDRANVTEQWIAKTSTRVRS